MKRTTSFWYLTQQGLILILHLILLVWMYYTLSHAGTFTFNAVLLHFVGMSIWGGLLIRGTAMWAKYHHEKNEQK